jgi:hypothetical protein
MNVSVHDEHMFRIFKQHDAARIGIIRVWMRTTHAQSHALYLKAMTSNGTAISFQDGSNMGAYGVSSCDDGNNWLHVRVLHLDDKYPA